MSETTKNMIEAWDANALVPEQDKKSLIVAIDAAVLRAQAVMLAACSQHVPWDTGHCACGQRWLPVGANNVAECWQDHIRALATPDIERALDQSRHDWLGTLPHDGSLLVVAGAETVRIFSGAALAEREREARLPLDQALDRINDIRNSIVGYQGFNFSMHAYPLVAALNAIGINGLGHEQARASLKEITAKIEKWQEDANASIAQLSKETPL